MKSETEQAVRGRLMGERDRLVALRSGLMEEGLSAEAENQSVGELSDADQHPADLGTETFNRERDQGLAESLEGSISEVDVALQRLEEGTYGTCVACGRPIPEERLEALPATPYCVEDAHLAAAEAAPGVAPINPNLPRP